MFFNVSRMQEITAAVWGVGTIKTLKRISTDGCAWGWTMLEWNSPLEVFLLIFTSFYLELLCGVLITWRLSSNFKLTVQCTETKQNIQTFFFSLWTQEIQMSCHEKIESCEEATEVGVTLTTLTSKPCEHVTHQIILSSCCRKQDLFTKTKRILSAWLIIAPCQVEIGGEEFKTKAKEKSK